MINAHKEKKQSYGLWYDILAKTKLYAHNKNGEKSLCVSNINGE